MLLATSVIYSQEICGNGIDDDGDGFVDHYDTDCPPTTTGTDNFGINSGCTTTPSATPLSVTNARSSIANIMIYSSPTIADIDNDGQTEIIAIADNSATFSGNDRRARNILIINSTTGATELTINTPFIFVSQFTPYAIADINNDGFGEIIVQLDVNGNAAADQGRLVCYSHTGVELWRSATVVGFNLSGSRYGNISIADIDQNGTAEVTVFDEVYSGQTGALLARGPGGAIGYGVDFNGNNYSMTVPANLTSHPGLELAAGKTVYEITITNTLGISGNTVNPITLAGSNDGLTAIADMNRDGQLDVVVGVGGPSGSLYIWDPRTNSLIASTALGTGFPGNAFNPVSVPFIGDMDNDCLPEIGITRRLRVFSYEYNGTTTLSLKWTLNTTDDSGGTGIVMFDFNQDGNQELVYRDETNLRILNAAATGSSPTTIASFPCTSGTLYEHPVVADIDNDGSAELVCGCGGSGSIPGFTGKINIYESNAAPWAPARPVWNQEAYTSTNIHNNLSVPQTQQNNAAAYTGGACNCSAVGIGKQPFNNFNVQQTSLDDQGCPVFPGGDVAITTILSYNSVTGQVSIQIDNAGDNDFPAGSSIAFYNGNPTTTNIPLLATGTTPSVILAHTTATFTFTVTPNLGYNLYVIINDNGSIPRPFNLATQFPSTSIAECNYVNNMLHLTPPNYDTDGDGVTDNLDLDLDNDGILNSEENNGLAAFGDEDGDGTINCQDVVDNGTGDGSVTNYVDADGNGIPDAYDFDNDGIINMIDLDSDNDGIYDRVESGETTGVDANADGRVDGVEGTDGVPDAVQAVGQENSGTVNYTILNTDAADFPNYKDYDSDNDACSDANEYYNSATADGGDGGPYGTGLPAVGGTGKVTAASYTGTYTPVVTAITLATVTTPPGNVTTLQGSSAYFNAVVTNGSSVPTYQWQVSTDGGTTWTNVVNDATYSGATSLYLLISNTPLSFNTHRYRIVLSQPDCACKVTSTAGILTVNASADSDGDGIPNTTDLDDDNDGILDTHEGSCSSLTTNEFGGTFGTTTVERNLATPPGGGYTFSSFIINAGNYTVASLATTPIHPDPTAWNYAGHTTGANDDAFLAVNGSTSVGTFYDEVLNFAAGATYTYSIWHAASGNGPSGDYQLGIRITRVSDGALVAFANSSTSGPFDQTWKPLALTFTSNTTENYRVSLINISTGSSGNDFAIDDIIVNPLLCGTNTDGDGSPDAVDLDSDNDGCPDVTEAGMPDPNHDGIAGGTPVTVNSNGLVTSASGLYLGTDPAVTTAVTPSLTVVTPPANQAVTVGANATYTVNATVTAPGTSSYQWQLSTNNGTTWTNIVNGAPYSGATTATLTVTGATIGMNGYHYRVRLQQTNYLCDSIITAGALLQVAIDSDSDGINDITDLDDDNDGILDSQENGTSPDAMADQDSDGILNYLDADLAGFVDANADGINDNYDYDLDGHINELDLDSDNDGIYDRVESGQTTGTDATNDGRTDGPVGTDGVPDAVQAAGQENSGTVNYTIQNSDAFPPDFPDYKDFDSDNDNCKDVIEAGYTDPDNNGMLGTSPVTTDANGVVTGQGGYTGTNANVTTAGNATMASLSPSNTTGLAGASTSFQVSASATPPAVVLYQWQLSTDGGATWTNIVNNATYSGATTYQLTISGLTVSMDGYDYRVYMEQSNYACRNATSASANLTVIAYPVANDDNGGTLAEDGANGTVAILTNDTDPNGNPTAPTNGSGQFTVDLDVTTAGIQTTFTDATGTWTYDPATGIVTFDPAGNYNGTATHTYELCDPTSLCDQAIITFIVTPVNDPPVVDNETHTIPEDTQATGDLTDAGDSDPEGTALTANTTPVSGPTNGTIVINANGTYTYTPNANFNGTDQVVVSICDAGIPLPALCANDTIFITVTPVNDPPVVDNETHTIPEDTQATGDLTNAGDSDPDGTALTANTTPVSGPTNGTIVINADGTYTYTPNANFNGTDQVVVSICDAGTPLPALCVNDTIFITVTPVNDPPVVDNETHTIPEDTQATGDLTNAGDSDPEGTALTANTTP
ncbi:Ig-like domain-containing protein, partial [Fluviicola sp.]|uniref:tandem-95 repeat protein n=1 Tax=Fluviicola sp. TaxID=1917219 RepID=UPI00262A4D3E